MKLKELLLLSNEKKIEGFFVRGNIQCGEYKEYRGHGPLWYHCFYLNGKRHGELKEYGYDGKLTCFSFYLNGACNGIYKEFDSEGNLIRHRLYKNNRCIRNFFHKKK